MIAEAGHFALVLATFVAIVQAILPMVGAHRNVASWMAVASPASIAQVVLVGISFACLTHAYVVSDFSVVNVVENSHSAKPMLYKVSGVWGNHEGSMLLWVLILALFGSAVGLFGRNLPPTLKARVLGIQALVAIGFYAFILFTSNPFQRMLPPAFDGRDLNPLLQDPGLAFHPPMLYIGYVGFSMAFSFAIAALIEGRVDAAWARWVRPWTLAAWAFLTGGIGLGSWWAYYELGWGGWWFWDPVENASFMPWLVGTALLHSAIVVEKRDTMKSWTIFLAIVTFSFSLLGTFLVRSGVLTSVHAFATDPERGVFILVLLLITVGGSLLLYAWRAPMLKATGVFQPISREGSLLLNNLLMTTACAAVLLGTLYPLFLDAIGGDKVSVGPPFFNAVFIPLMIPMIAAMVIGPMLSWKRADAWGALKRLWIAFVGFCALFVTVLAYASDTPIIGPICMGLAAWLGLGTLIELAERVKLGKIPLADSLSKFTKLPRASWGMTLGHLGLAIGIVGMVGAGLWKEEHIQVMQPGDSVVVQDYTITFDGAENARGPNYRTTIGHMTVTEDGQKVYAFDPEKRVYDVRTMDTTEAAIRTQWDGDLYVAIGDPQGDGGFVVRVWYNPFVVWMWIGCTLMVIAGFVSLTDRRYRIGVPQGKKKAAAIPAGAAVGGAKLK
ncbi:MAG: heme lyase CcmF/NrfE family subunit [Magnetovibrionaceae bacterium]